MFKTQYLRILFFLCISVSLISCTQFLKSSAKSSSSNKSKSSLYQPPKYHRILKGETLYSIAWFYGYDYRQIALWNDIDYPYLIKPGQEIQLYPSLVRRASQNTRIRHNKRAVSQKKQDKRTLYRSGKRAKKVVRKKRYEKKVQQKRSKSKKTNYASKIKWGWPARGKIVHRFNSKHGKKGLDISGKKGQRILAAAAGTVVYSGSGLRGYGKLIIIKHNDTYLSAYANNKKILVKEQQKVKFGEHIAAMGSNGANKTILHFEIRKNGKPVNPIRYLPR